MEQKVIVPTLSRERVEDYRKRLCQYLLVMYFFKELMDIGDLSMEDYEQIEKMFLEKYRINEKSLVRMDLKSIAERDSLK